MITNKAMGLIFANMHGSSVGNMTAQRTMASLPFAGRYRLIDFCLSSFVCGGVREVGVIVKENYHSLMNHLGSGKEWDLSRKIAGLKIYPPFVGSLSGLVYHGKIAALYNVLPYIKNSGSNHIILADCDHVCNFDSAELVNEHIDAEADVTFLCYEQRNKNESGLNSVSILRDEDGRVVDIDFNRPPKENYFISTNIIVINRELLIDLVEDAYSHRLIVFERDILQHHMKDLFIHSVVFDGFVRRINSVQSYFTSSMSLLDSDNRNCLFNLNRPIYTKVNDDAPARYGIGSSVKNSLVADGCIIEGKIENCLLFRGVKVLSGSVLKNCIIMQDTVIEEGANLSYVIADKEVMIGKDRFLMGYESYPLYIQKSSVV